MRITLGFYYLINTGIVWGGLYTDEPQCGNVLLKILLNAGRSPILGFAYDLFFIIILLIGVKIAMTRGKSAGVRSIHTSAAASQRLHAGDLNRKNMGKRFYHTSHFNSNKSSAAAAAAAAIDPRFITGFCDGEASFHISVLNNNLYKSGYSVSPLFTIHLHSKDFGLLEQIKDYFNAGTLRKRSSNSKITAIYSVKSIVELENSIFPHFDKYPLLTQKKADFLLFKQIISLIKEGKHLTNEGLKEILSIKASMNKGLNENLTKEFSNLTPVQRPILNPIQSSDFNTNWLLGFIEAEGCFQCLVRKNNSHKTGFQVSLNFTLTQHSRDLDLMVKLKNHFGLGTIYESSSAVRWVITKKAEIDTLISLLNNKLVGAKSLELKDFVFIQDLINKNIHKTEEGLNQISEIKNNMNTRRNSGEA